MSAAFIPFLYELRARKVKVGPQEANALAKALILGLHDNSLDGFYHLARALCVHREGDLDAFDEALLAYYKGITPTSLELIDELDAWLKDPANQDRRDDEEAGLLRHELADQPS